jgi:hypothetical protein
MAKQIQLHRILLTVPGSRLKMTENVRIDVVSRLGTLDYAALAG